mgnify:CR=1 FL=1
MTAPLFHYLKTVVPPGAVKLFPVVLNARCSEARQAVFVDRALPRQEFIDCQRVALTGFFHAQQTTANRRDDLSLTPNNPALGIPRGKIGNCKRSPIGSDHIAPARSHLLFGHDTQYTLSDHNDVLLGCD